MSNINVESKKQIEKAEQKIIREQVVYTINAFYAFSHIDQ